MSKRIRIFFTAFADAGNYNAQSLNMREIARRLDPERFASTLFYQKEPDPRLNGTKGLRLIKVPQRLGTFKMLITCLLGHDIVFKPSYNLLGYLFFKTPRVLRKDMETIEWIEGPVSENYKELEGRRKACFNYVFPRMGHYVSITDHIAETTQRDFGVKASHTIPAGVDTALFHPPLQKTDRAKPRVVFVGPLIERKGPHMVLRAAAQLRDRADFVLIGQPRDGFYGELQNTVQVQGLDNVTFMPNMPQEQLAEVLRKSDVLMHPSTVEGSPKVVIEGAAAGLPAVMYSHYRSPAVVDGETGFQVDTPDEMLGRVRLLVEDAGLRRKMGQAAIRHARGFFDWDVIAARWQDFFEEICLRKS